MACGCSAAEASELAKANSEWLKPWENFSAATKLGVLVLAGSAQGFQAWASKPEAKLEMQYTPKGRLYVYLADGGSSDGADVGGVIVALTEEGCATVENGKGTILYADGSMYSGDILVTSSPSISCVGNIDHITICTRAWLSLTRPTVPCGPKMLSGSL